MKEKCKICGREFIVSKVGSHIIQTHKLNMQDYIETYYNFPKSVVEWKCLSLKDVLFAQDLLLKYPQYNNYVDLFQYLYDEYNDMRTLDKAFGRDMGKLCICLGVKTNRNLSNTHKQKISKARKGQKLSNEHKEKIKMGYYNLPEDIRKGIGRIISKKNTGRRHSKESIEKMIKNRSNPKHPYRGKAGIREDLGIYVRSTWEANFARVLNYMGVEFEFEPTTFWLDRPDGGQYSYTPDFYLPKTDEYIEVKGYWMDDAKEKFELFKQQYSDIKIKVVDSQKYKIYENRYKSKIESWE